MNKHELREEAYDDCIKYSCPDVTELIPAPVIACECGYKGRVRLVLSHLHEAQCPQCEKWVKYEEI